MGMYSVDCQRFMVKIARKYYEDDMTQAEIASLYGISRQKVQRLLDQGKKSGVIQILIRPPLHVYENFERDLEQLYGLREAVVVDAEPSWGEESLRASIGLGAAEYLLKIIRENLKITISWGETLSCMAKSLSQQLIIKKYKNMKIIQGLGFVSEPSRDSHSCEIVNILAGMLNAKKYLLSAPGIAVSREAREYFLNDPNVSEVLRMARCADVAFLGIGVLTPDTMVMKRKDSILWSEMEELKKRGAVGDITLRYFDKNGVLIPSDIDQRVVGLTLEEVRRIEHVVGVAGGLGKVEAIRGALIGKLINVLITDHVTAQALISRHNEEKRFLLEMKAP